MQVTNPEAWSNPLFLKALLYLALFGAIVLAGLFLVLIAGKREASGWVVFLAMLVTVGTFVYLEFLAVPPPPAPVVEAPAPPPPPPPEPEPKPVPPPPEPEPEPKPVATPRPPQPYALKLIERRVSRGSAQANYRGQGPSQQPVEDLIIGDAIETAFIDDGESPAGSFNGFREKWKKELRDATEAVIEFTSKDRDPRGWTMSATADLAGVRQVLEVLGFRDSTVEPMIRVTSHPGIHPAHELAEEIRKATYEQSRYTLGGKIHTDPPMLQDDIRHLDFIFEKVRYFVDPENFEIVDTTPTGVRVLYEVKLTPGASD